MQTITQQTSEHNTLTQTHYELVSMLDVKKLNLAHQLQVLEIEMQKQVKDWEKINFLNTDIAKMKNYIKCFNNYKN